MNASEANPSPSAASHGAGDQKHICPGCAGMAESAPDRYVYAIGKLDVRFPSLGIEKEFQQRERQLFAGKSAPKARGELLHKVLEANVHLAQRVCYLLYVGGVPAHIVAPGNASVRTELLTAVKQISKPDAWVVVIGRSGPVSGPTSCGGILAPLVTADQIYAFSEGEWFDSLKAKVEPVLESRQTKVADFRDAVSEAFARIVHSGENVGASDAHRALNYAVVQHPGLFLAYIERAERHVLDRIETRLVQGIGTRRLVAVILTFLERSTGVPERLFCRVDVTEEWPFLSGAVEGSTGPLGLLPFVESESLVGVV